MFKKLFLLIAFGSLFLCACDSQRIYEQNIDLDDTIWLGDSIQIFDFEIKENQYYHNIFANLRTLVGYPFQNIYVGYWLENEEGRVLATNTEDPNNLLDIQIFDPKSGKPLGDGLGDLFDQRQVILSDYQFEANGFYRLKLKHYMRADQLPGIVSVGVRVEVATKED